VSLGFAINVTKPVLKVRLRISCLCQPSKIWRYQTVNQKP